MLCQKNRDVMPQGQINQLQNRWRCNKPNGSLIPIENASIMHCCVDVQFGSATTTQMSGTINRFLSSGYIDHQKSHKSILSSLHFLFLLLLELRISFFDSNQAQLSCCQQYLLNFLCPMTQSDMSFLCIVNFFS